VEVHLVVKNLVPLVVNRKNSKINSKTYLISKLDMSIKIFVIGDPHFKINNVEETNEMCEKILFHLEQTQPHAVICLGDVLDRHETIHVGPLLRSIDFFQKISSKFPLYILIGNHDRPSNQVFLTEEHPFTALKMWKNTWIVDKVMENEIQGNKFLFVPYVAPGRFMEAIQKEKEQNLEEYCCIFAHQEFLGAKMGMCESTIGDPWPLENPLVVSGHIHDFDQLAPNLIYTGTPIQHAFGDREDKGVFIFEFTSQGSSKGSSKGFHFRKIDLDLPKKKIIKVSFSEVSLLKKLDQQSYYKIVISGTPEELKTLKLNQILQNHPRCKIVYKTISSSLDQMNREVEMDSKGFLELLYDEIERKEDFEERQELREMVQELFGVLESQFVIV
jgi:DNA repair exonuclease SbcCD nuclease subunit